MTYRPTCWQRCIAALTVVLLTLMAGPGRATAQDKNDPPEKTAKEKGLLKKPSGKKDLFRFSFADAKWDRVVQSFADHWDLALTEPAVWPEGGWSYTDPRTFDQREAMDIINSVLMTKGYVLVRRDRILLLHNLEADGPVPDSWVTEVKSEKELEELGEFELRKMAFRIEGAEFDTAETELRNIVERSEDEDVKLPGRVIAMPASRQLMVTETGGNLRAIARLVKAIGGDGGIKAFVFENVTVDEALTPVKQLLGIPEDLMEATDGSVRLSAFPATNSLLVTSSKPEVFKQLEEIRKLVDVKAEQTKGPEAEVPTLEIYSVAGPDPETVLKVLQSMLSGNIGVRLTADPVTGNIIAYGVKEDHALIQGYVKKLAGPARNLRIWPLRFAADPQIVVATITELLGSSEPAGEGEDATPGMGPKLLVDTNTRELLAFGNEEQLNHIDKLMKMRRWTESSDAGATSDGRPFRVIPLHPDVVPLIKQHLPSVRRNPIEVIDLSKERKSSNSGIESIEPSRRHNNGFGRSRLEQLKESLDKKRKNKANGATKTNSRGASDSAPAKTPSGDRTTRRQPRRMVRARFAVHTSLQTEKAEPAEDKAAKEKPEKAAGADKKASEPKKKRTLPAGSEDAPVRITVFDDRIVISSEDLEALDEIERMLQQLIPSVGVSSSGGFKVFVLKHVSASTAKATLDQVLTGDTGAGDSTGSNLLGDVASGMLGGVGGAMVEGLLGSGSSGSLGSLVAGTPLIVAEDRLNALIVQAGPDEVQLIRDLLEIIDQPDTPENDVARKPWLIPVFHTNAQDVATNLRELYSDRLVTGGSGGGNRQPSPREFIEALRGGGRNQRGGQKQDPNANKMAISVDARSNTLLVVAPQPLYLEVKDVVEVLDYASEEPNNEVRQVITLKSVSPEALASALRAIGGEKVKTTTSSSTMPTAPGAAPGAPAPGQPGARPEQRGPSPREQIERMQQIQQFFNRSRGGDTGSRGGPGGGVRGGGGGGPFGGGRRGGPGGGRRGGGR